MSNHPFTLVPRITTPRDDPEMEKPARASAEKMSPTLGGRTFTPAQLMKKLQVSENTIYWELQHGSLKSVAFRIGRSGA